MDARNYEKGRLETLSKSLFAKDIMDITYTNVAMKLSEAAIQAITVVKFYESYMGKNGHLSSENIKEHIDQVIQYVCTCN